MHNDQIPIFKKIYELTKLIHHYRFSIPKADRHSLWQKIEQLCLDLLELTLYASQEQKTAKLPLLRSASIKLSTVRFLIRMAKDLRIIDTKKYLALQSIIDEIGRMLGGWLRSLKSDPPPPAFWQRRTHQPFLAGI